MLLQFDLYLRPTELPYLEQFGLAHDAFGDLMRLLLLRGALEQERVRSLLGSEAFDLLVSLGLIVHRAGGWAAAVDVFPIDGLLVATDHRYQVLEGDHLEEEPVMYLGRDSVGLAQVAPRTPSRRHLDLCTGSGVQALLARGYADAVVGVDLNPRAIRFARFNADLNGLDGIQFHLGDLFDPVQGARFDTITANPPFVASPLRDLAFRDGGADGEEVLRRIVQGAAAHLEPGGRVSIVTDLVDVSGYEDKLSSWWRGGAYLGLLLTTADRDEQLFSVPHAHAPFGQSYEEFSKELASWVESYRAAGIGVVNFGYLVLEDSGPSGERRLVQRVVQSPVHPVYDRVHSLLESLHMCSTGALDACRVVSAPGLRLCTEQGADGTILACSASAPGDDWFTTYQLGSAMHALLEEAGRGTLSWGDLVQRGTLSQAEVLLEKGLLVREGCTTEHVPPPPEELPARRMLLDELASKTTPTCVSNYLR